MLQRARDVGLDVRHFPIIDVWIPRPDEADDFDALIADIRASLDGGPPRHGRMGEDRPSRRRSGVTVCWRPRVPRSATHPGVVTSNPPRCA
jgi:hypothetical protein